MRLSSQRGFSFVEIMIGVVMGFFVMVSMGDLFQSGLKLFHKTEQALEAFQSGVLTTKILEQDFNTLILPEANDTGEFYTDPPGYFLESGTENDTIFRPFVWAPESGQPPLRLAHPDKKRGPLLLSSCTDPFVFFRVEEDGGMFKMQKVSYSLIKGSFNGFDFYQLERTTELEGESPEVHKYSMHIKDVALDLRWVPWDSNASKEDIEAGEVTYYLHLWICGVSSNIDSRKLKKSAKGKKLDFFPHVCMRTVALEVLNERLSSRRGGLYWRNLRAGGSYLTGKAVLAK